MMGARFKKSLLGGLFLGLAAMLILPLPALAGVTQWVGPAGAPGNEWVVPDNAWNIRGNWNPEGVPASGDEVLIDKPGANVLYLNSSNPMLKSLRLGLKPEDSSSDEFTFTQNLEPGRDFLTVKNSEIGSKGTANYYHNGGTHKVLQNLTFGTDADGQGIYYFGGDLYLSGGMKRWAWPERESCFNLH